MASTELHSPDNGVWYEITHGCGWGEKTPGARFTRGGACGVRKFDEAQTWCSGKSECMRGGVKFNVV